MRKIYSFLLLFMAVTMGAMAQSVYTYEPKDVSLNDWSWPAGTALSATDATKDVVIRNNNAKVFFVGVRDNHLKIDNNLQGQQVKFRFFKEANNANRYKIYAVGSNKFVTWTTDQKLGNITALVDSENEAKSWLVVNDNNANSFNGAFDIIAGDGNYSNGATCWNVHGGFNGGDADEKSIGGWDANDGNSAWQICKEYETVLLTYNLHYEGAKKRTVSVSGYVGENFPACALPANCSATYPTGKVTVASTHEINVTRDSDYPFVPIASFTQTDQWYVLTIRGKYISYNKTTHQLERRDAAPTTYTDEHLFQFQGNPFDGYKILNRAAGAGKAAGSASVADKVVLEMVDEASARTYQLTSGFHFRESTNPNGYLNDNQGVSYWMHGAAANDVGGKFTFTKIDLNDHLISYKKRKAELNHLLSNTSAQALFNATTVTTVKNEMTAYNPENTEAGNTTALAKVEEWYNTLYTSINTQVTLQTPVRSGKYVTVDLAGQVVHKPTKGAESAFLVKGSAAGLTFTHPASTRKVGKTGSNGGYVLLAGLDAAEQGVFKLKVFEGNNDQVAFICTQPGHNNFNAVHADQNGNVVAWSAGEVGGSTWKVEKSTYSDTDILTAAKQRLKEAKQHRPLGFALGQYILQDEAKYENAQHGNDIPTIEGGVSALMEASLNMPETGEFFRIKSTKNGNKYVSANHSSNNRLSLVDEADKSTLFYFSETSLLSVDQGKLVGLKDGKFAAMQEYNGSGQPVEFKASKVSTLYRINIGERAFAADGSSNQTDAGGKDSDSDVYRFQLESVTEFPIAIGETGYATFFTPVEASLQQAEAYQAKKEGDKLVLKLISGTIPANTAFIIKGTPGSNATLELQLPTSSTLTDNALIGSAVTPTTPVNGETVYGLTKGDNDQPVFAKLANGVYKRAFRAFLPAAAGGAQALEFDFGHVTGLEALGTAVHETPVYDLSGRRVLTPAQGGVYLQNGKKFIQK